MKAFIIMPTYNEADNLDNIVTRIFLLHPTFNIIVVDDNSPDGTGAIADALAEKDSRLHVVHRAQRAGLGTAYITGFKDALTRGADLIFEMDAVSHRPEYLRDFLEASKKSDLVVGSRYLNGIRVEGWRFHRLMISKLANLFVSRIVIRPIWDFTSGFRCYRRAVLESIDLDSIKSDGYAFQIEMIYRAFENNFAVTEIPIIFRHRQYPYWHINRKNAWRAFWLSLKFHAPITRIIKHRPFFYIDSAKFFARISEETKR